MRAPQRSTSFSFANSSAFVLVAIIALAFQTACRCGDLDEVTATLSSKKSVGARRQAIRCVTAGERSEEKWVCPLPEQQSWRSQRSLRPIAYALGDDDPEVRREGLVAFELLLKCPLQPRPDADAAAAFVSALRGGDPSVRPSAVIGLTIVGDPSRTTSALMAVLADEQEKSGARRAAAEMLCTMGDASAVPALVSLLGKWDTPLQLAALRRLTALGANAETALTPVAEVLRSGPSELQFAAAEAVGALCVDGSVSCAGTAAAAIVASFARTGAGPLRQFAAPDSRLRALAAIGEGAMPSLAAALDDSRPIVRRLGLEALGGMWQFGSGSWSLRRSPRRQHEVARIYCAGSPAVLRAIARLQDEDREVSAAAEAALTEVAGFLLVCPSIRAALDSATGDSDPRVQRVARKVRSAKPVQVRTANLEDGRLAQQNTDPRGPMPNRSTGDGFVNLPDAVKFSLADPGEVTLGATVTSTGAVSGIRILDGENALLATACATTLKTWRYAPGTRNGRPDNFDLVYRCRSILF